MIDIETKEKIVEKWLDRNGFYNIQITANNHFVKADGNNSRMFIAIEDESDFYIDVQKVKEFASKNKREAWIAKVKPSEEKIEWKILEL